jgi:L-ascorbate metabolism protein UlaG (beta-lactamase superfamily)
MAEHKTNPYYSGPVSDHFDGRCFFLSTHNTRKSAADLRKWRAERQPAKWPKWVRHPKQPTPPAEVNGDSLSVTFIGHATALLQVCGLNILTDPFFSMRTSPVQWAGPRRVHAPGVALKDLPPVHVALVSHNHYDHMDLPALRKLHDAHKPRIVTPLGNGPIISKARRKFDITEADWGDEIRIAEGVSIVPTEALHWSKRTLWDRNMALWAAFVIRTPHGIVYFAADTGYGDGAHFRAVREAFGAPRLALIPIGAYEPRWFMKPQHINPAEAVQAHLGLGAHHSLGIHHGTVQLTDEGITEPVSHLAEAMEQHGIDATRFRTLTPGESWSIPPVD